MESQRQQENASQPSEIAKFYAGKSLFITGAAGYLGTVLLETLLRCCPGICGIYILIRPKKGVLPEDRKENVFKKSIFNEIREKYPDRLDKVFVVQGDVAHDNLGISSEDMCKMSQEVAIVFHCAAAVSFLKPLSFIIQQNVIGTNNVIEFCKKIKKLEAFVYTSTAYSNCNYFDNIEEKIYKLPFTAEDVLKAHKTDGEEELMLFFSKCEPKFPNFYTFSKSVCESLIAEKAPDLPTVIVRPSVVTCCIKGPQPGYVEDGTSSVNLIFGVCKGFIHVLFCNYDKKCNLIPVDVVTNTHIIGAYRKATEKSPSLHIYNCVAKPSQAWDWETRIDFLMKLVKEHPVPNRFQRPGVTLCNNNVKYWILSIFHHYIPAVIIDALLWLSCHKPRLVKFYRLYDRSMNATKHFCINEWTFKTENYLSIDDKLNDTDKELFFAHMPADFKLENLIEIVVKGTPMYREDCSTSYDKGTSFKYVPDNLTIIIKWAVLGIIVSALYFAIF